MKYTEDFFKKLKKTTGILLRDLEKYKLQGSYETKLNLNDVIQIIKNQDGMIDSLLQELKQKEDAHTKEINNLKQELQEKEVTHMNAINNLRQNLRILRSQDNKEE